MRLPAPMTTVGQRIAVTSEVSVESARSVLVIGGTGGIGAALARTCAAHGWHVHLIARDRARLQSLGDEIGADWSAADVLSEAALATAIAGALGDRPLHGLAYCVGSIDLAPLSTVTTDRLDHAFRLNCVGAAIAVRESAAALRLGQGSVVLFSTVAVAQGFTHHAVVASAKGAVEGLTRALAAELAPAVRVNCVAPSLTETPLSARITANPGIAKSIAALHAIPRLGQPTDIAETARFLLEPGSAWITGQVIAVDGGRSRVRTKG